MSGTELVTASLVALSLAALLLAALVFRPWRTGGSVPHLYWGIGLVLVFVTTLEEAVVYAGTVSAPLLTSYFVLVAILVGILSLGSAELVLKGRVKALWSSYILGLGALTAILGVVYPIPSAAAVLTGGVVTGNPPLAVLASSSLLTISASVMLAGSALYAAFWGKNWQLLYIAAGIIFISIAGSLFAFFSTPVLLYYAEFGGFVLLFLGFVKVPGLSAPLPRSLRRGSTTVPQ